jgi:hypothetical protein
MIEMLNQIFDALVSKSIIISNVYAVNNGYQH